MEKVIQNIYPSYVATILISVPYLALLLYYGLNVSFYCEKVFGSRLFLCVSLSYNSVTLTDA